MDLADLAWPAVAALSRETPVVIPIAALEQHGHHLPVFTDSLLLGEVIRRVKPQFTGRALFTPLMWLGNSMHHIDFPGSMSAEPRTYLDLLEDMAGNFLRHGFRRIVFVNGHGGNDVPGRQATFELRQRHRERDDILLVLATYWALGARPWESGPALHQREMGHACEWETSMILRIAPELVGDYRAATPVEAAMGLEPASQAWVTRERTRAGHIGYPHLATQEKGEHLFRVFADDVAGLIERVIGWKAGGE